MTFKDRIRNSTNPVTDISNMFREVMNSLEMEVHPGIESVVENNNYSKLRDYLKTGKSYVNMITAMIVTVALETGSKPVATPIIHDKVLEVLDLDIA